MTKQSLFAQFVTLEAEYKDLGTRRDALRQVIVEEMQKNGTDKEENTYGKFTVASKKSYTYTEAVNKKVEALKLAKYKEEKNGKATVSETHYLRFTAVEVE